MIPTVANAFKGGGYQPNMQTEGSPFAPMNYTDYTSGNTYDDFGVGYGQDFGNLGLGDMSIDYTDYTSGLDYQDFGNLYGQ